MGSTGKLRMVRLRKRRRREDQKTKAAVEGFRARVHPSTAAVGIGFRRYQVRSVRGTEQCKSRKWRDRSAIQGRRPAGLVLNAGQDWGQVLSGD